MECPQVANFTSSISIFEPHTGEVPIGEVQRGGFPSNGIRSAVGKLFLERVSGMVSYGEVPLR